MFKGLICNVRIF